MARKSHLDTTSDDPSLPMNRTHAQIAQQQTKEPVIVPPKPGELLPCPFCGSEAGLEHDAEGTVANWRVYCRDARDDEDCPIGYTNTSGRARRVEAVAAWNKRAHRD